MYQPLNICAILSTHTQRDKTFMSPLDIQLSESLFLYLYTSFYITHNCVYMLIYTFFFFVVPYFS